MQAKVQVRANAGPARPPAGVRFLGRARSRHPLPSGISPGFRSLLPTPRRTHQPRRPPRTRRLPIFGIWRIIFCFGFCARSGHFRDRDHDVRLTQTVHRESPGHSLEDHQALVPTDPSRARLPSFPGTHHAIHFTTTLRSSHMARLGRFRPSSTAISSATTFSSTVRRATCDSVTSACRLRSKR